MSGRECDESLFSQLSRAYSAQWLAHVSAAHGDANVPFELLARTVFDELAKAAGVLRVLDTVLPAAGPSVRIADLGAGRGLVAHVLANHHRLVQRATQARRRPYRVTGAFVDRPWTSLSL